MSLPSQRVDAIYALLIQYYLPKETGGRMQE